jgi:CheY-like chemotaxis protein
MCEVLLVDDDSSILLTLSIALRRRGHEVTVACDAQQALNQLARHTYDFLITDIRMPEMSGLELARRAQTTPHPPRVVLTSAHYDPTQSPNPASQVADEFFPKPIDIEKLDALLCQSLPPPKSGTPTSTRQAKPPLFFSAGNALLQPG